MPLCEWLEMKRRCDVQAYHLHASDPKRIALCSSSYDWKCADSEGLASLWPGNLIPFRLYRDPGRPASWSLEVDI